MLKAKEEREFWLHSIFLYSSCETKLKACETGKQILFI